MENIYRSPKALSGSTHCRKNLPREYRFDLGGQALRSAFSIVLNIAEGSGKSSDRELNRYLDISLGSAYETKAALDMFVAGGFYSKDDNERLTCSLKELVSQIGGFKSKLKLRQDSKP